MGVCTSELEGILTKVPEDVLKELKDSAISGDIVRIKQILMRYVKVKDCLNIDNIKRHVIRKLISNYVGVNDYVTYEFELNPPPGRSLASGMYPCYNVAELVYSSLYESDPSTAHERMYEILEPILLSDSFRQEEKKSLFLPIDESNWDAIQELLVSVLAKLDAERRRMFCSGFTRFFRMILYCMPISSIESLTGITAKIRVSGRLVNTCPEMKTVLEESVL